MDNLLEILIPLIFFAIYFVSNLLGKKESEGEEESKDQTPDDLRKIREELRRKIQERRKNNPGEYTKQKEEAPRPEPASGGAVLRESQPHRGMAERRQPAPAPQVEPEPNPFAESQIERDLQAQMRQVQLAQEKAEAARREARKKVASVQQASAKRKTANKATNYRQFLREALDDPENLQKSFVLHEVFGTPVGLRRDGQMRSSFDL